MVTKTVVSVAVPSFNEGKGSAIRRAWHSASPEATWLAFLDADGAIPSREFWRLEGMLSHEAPFDVLATSRVMRARLGGSRGTGETS